MKKLQIIPIIILIVIAIALIAGIPHIISSNKTYNHGQNITITSTIIPNSTFLTPTGPCSLSTNSQSNNTLTCAAGQNFTGFKVLAIKSSTIQILIYDNCGTCSHTTSNMDQFLSTMNISIGESFGSPCQGIYPSKLIGINTTKLLAIIRFNMSNVLTCP